MRETNEIIWSLPTPTSVLTNYDLTTHKTGHVEYHV